MKRPAHDGASLLADLTARGFSLRADGDRLFVSPREGLTEADAEGVRACKVELLALLRGPTAEEAAAAIAERLGAEPVDFSTGPVQERESALVWVFDRWVAVDPESLHISREWNARDRSRKAGACPHAETEFGRVLGRKVTHVMERCKACLVNVRGAGRWVPGKDLPVPADRLPVFADRREPSPPSGAGLFGGES